MIHTRLLIGYWKRRCVMRMVVLQFYLLAWKKNLKSERISSQLRMIYTLDLSLGSNDKSLFCSIFIVVASLLFLNNVNGVHRHSMFYRLRQQYQRRCWWHYSSTHNNLKAAILQHTADYIYQLEQEKTRLLSQNCQLKRLVSKQEGELLSTASVHKKRKLEDPAGIDDGGMMIDEVTELRAHLEREQSLRVELEEQLKDYAARLGETFVDTKSKESTQTTIQYHNTNTCVVGEEAGMEIIEVNESDNLVVQREPEEESELLKTETVAPEDDRLKVATVVEASAAQPQPQQQVLPSARVYLTSTSRQNLETIVEAIRHLEGDHLFSDDHQDAPLALTKHTAVSNQKLLKVEMNPFLQFHSGSQTSQGTTVVTSNSPVRPSRPGVIVGKQAS
ncbi:uncharacterized protein LOC126894732 isoform X1 [Daktulosphaira vitifoliae]|uniref:uncharacterized protein LOC126894732 isoform X1 n=1 Tax=Daktulosphaira vitifoliae TaxID=58002 RepID=UPI0021AA9743|nr:uncharacterized protein LOC126894732 isoform X1 [Daktulosphaira vitifoliae]